MKSFLSMSSRLYLIRCNYLHSSCINWGSQSGRAMKKILTGSAKKKFHYKETPSMPNPNVLTKGAFEGKYSSNSRRTTVLNKLFMKHITDLMASGDYANEVLGFGIEINRVQVAPDYKILKVYWIARGTDNDEIVENVLAQNGWKLRHELSELRVMGEVPIIQFVKDKHYAHIVELDTRLSKADFGEDYEPLEVTTKFKTQLQLLTPLEHSIKNKIYKLDEVSQEIDDFDEAALPPMPQNVMGVNHGDILNRIQKSMKKSEAIHRQSSTDENWASFKVNQAVNEDPVKFDSVKGQREMFKEFLHKRQILKQKEQNMNKNYLPDLDYIREEMQERHKNLFSNITEDDHSEDYIIDDDEEPK